MSRLNHNQAGELDAGFHEVCAIVHDVEDSVRRLCKVFGYSLLWQGDASRGVLELLGVAGDITGVEALIGDAEQGRGYIRLFAFPGQNSGVMRDGAQPWDTGGIFDINVFALNTIEGLHRAMTQNGFRAFGPVTSWNFGDLAVKEVVECDADGLAIALIERVVPPLAGYEHVRGEASYVMNSTQTVPSFEAARAFYVEALGWGVVQESSWTSEDGSNCIGLPLDAAKKHQLSVGIYQAKGLNEGSVEILEYAGEGLDFSGAAPPDRGWASLRFPMADIEDFLARAGQGGATILPIRTIVIEPYGEVEAAVAITPWGVRLEAYCPVT